MSRGGEPVVVKAPVPLVMTCAQCRSEVLEADRLGDEEECALRDTSWPFTRTRFSPRRSACCSGASSRDRRHRGRSRAAPTQADRLRTNGANTQNRRMQVQHTQGRQQRSMTRRSPTRVGQRRWMSEEPQPGHETVIARGVLSVRGPGSEGRASTTKPSTTPGQQREGGQRQSLCGVSFRGPRRRTRWRCVPLAVRWRARFQDDRRRRSVRP